MKIINTLVATALLTISANAQSVAEVLQTTQAPKVHIKKGTDSKEAVKPYYQGEVIETLNAGGYTYLHIDEKTPGYDPKKLKSFWIAVSRSEAKVGDYVRFQKELVTENFKSKTLNKTFKELMFASNLEYRVSK
ncbi:MAG: hypothetical protein U9P72_06850 [Campylobacterota bacterium]|nr:hypothetical protein [Campylobacterota bacterium]